MKFSLAKPSRWCNWAIFSFHDEGAGGWFSTKQQMSMFIKRLRLSHLPLQQHKVNEPTEAGQSASAEGSTMNRLSFLVFSAATPDVQT